jgi:hypothetical protein
MIFTRWAGRSSAAVRPHPTREVCEKKNYNTGKFAIFGNPAGTGIVEKFSGGRIRTWSNG